MKSNKFKEIVRALKFTIISISAGIIQIATFALFNDVLSMDYWASYITSLLLSILWNFTINRKITFKSSSNIVKSMILILLFYVVFTPVSTILGDLAVKNNINEYIVLAITMVSNFVLEFLYTRYIVYRNSCDTNTDKNNKTDKPKLLFRIFSFLVKTFYKKMKNNHIENIPDEPSLIISNHAKTNGPIAYQLYFPYKKRIWCIGQMMNIKEVPSYSYQDFWSEKPKCIKWLYKILSYLIAPLASYIFKEADTLPVYKDERIIYTFKQTVNSLKEGNHVIIFPEHHVKYNDIVNDFQDKFIDIARLYYKNTGKCLSFVPAYIAVQLKKIVYGKPIKYNPNDDPNNQREIIKDYLMNEITNLAKDLPKHKVIAYENISKRKQHYNK